MLKIEKLSVLFNMYKSGFKREKIEVIHSLSIEVKKGEIMAVIGSSGSGKSIAAESILGLLPQNAEIKGRIEYNGEEMNKKTIKKYLGHSISYIPQSVDHLDPLMKSGKQVVGVNGSKEKQKELYKKFGLENTENMYPFEMSGGMLRRVFICGAFMGDPQLIIADEPTSGLGEELALKTLGYFREAADMGAAVLIITHDIDLAMKTADQISVFYGGTVVETAPADDFIKGSDRLRHPYSKALIDALPQNGFTPIDGKQPYSGNMPKGCVFYDRCSKRSEKCREEIEMHKLRGGKVRCIYAV